MYPFKGSDGAGQRLMDRLRAEINAQRLSFSLPVHFYFQMFKYYNNGGITCIYATSYILLHRVWNEENQFFY